MRLLQFLRADGPSAKRYVPAWLCQDDTWFNLPPENPDLLSAFPRPGEEYGVSRHLPSCQILSASRAEHDWQRRTAALADALAYEAAVAEDTLILHPDDATAAGYLDVMHVALSVIAGRALPLAVTR